VPPEKKRVREVSGEPRGGVGKSEQGSYRGAEVLKRAVLPEGSRVGGARVRAKRLALELATAASWMFSQQ